MAKTALSSTAISYFVVPAALILSTGYGLGDESIEGRYCGLLLSRGSLAQVVTVLATQANGLLVGSYEFSDLDEITKGSLLESGKQAEDARTLTWTDKYGNGRLVIAFNQSRSAFIGKWGSDADAPSYRWDGALCDGASTANGSATERAPAAAQELNPSGS